MKLATTTGDLHAYTLSQQEAVKNICKAGFKYLDYNFHGDYTKNSGIFGSDPKAHIEDVKRLADSLGVKFVQAHSPMGKPLLEEGQAEFIEATRQCIEACAVLGVPNLVVHSGYVLGYSLDRTFEANKEFYMKLLPTAEKYGINILVENFNKMAVNNMYWIDNAPDQLALIEYVDHPLFHACWDTGHGNMQEMSEYDSLKILGSHVKAVHIQDNPGNSDAHMIPFCGTMNMDSIINGLLDIGYDGYFTFESRNIFAAADKRRKFDCDTRLYDVPMEMRIAAEKLLYEVGRITLSTYGIFEE